LLPEQLINVILFAQLWPYDVKVMLFYFIYYSNFIVKVHINVKVRCNCIAIEYMVGNV